MPKEKSKSKNRDKKYTIVLTPLSATLWGVFLFFLLGWIFVLGILVGRGFLPESVTTIADLRGQIEKLQEMVGHKDLQDNKIKKEPEPDPKLAFYEKLSSKKQETKSMDNSSDTTSTSENTEAEIVKAQNEPDLPETHLENDTQEVMQPREDLFEMSDSDAKFTVQIASLGELDKAEKLVNTLLDKGYPAYFYEARVDDKTYYRIRCGKFRTREEAQQYSKKLANEEGIKGFVSRLE